MAKQRSESTEYERARRDRAERPRPSIAKSILNPKEAALMEAMNGEANDRMRAAGGPMHPRGENQYGSVRKGSPEDAVKWSESRK